MTGIPNFASALMRALHFDHPEPAGLRALDDGGWESLLAFADSMHLTLSLGNRCGAYLPEWVRARVEQNVAGNSARFDQTKLAYRDMAQAWKSAGVEHLVLKGFAQWPGYANPRQRMQGDIDIFCPPAQAPAARDAIEPLGYVPLKGFDHSPSDHLPAMIRNTGWQWAGDYFDPAMPMSVDIHFRFWDPGRMRFAAGGLEQFWHRRVERSVEDLSFPTLNLADGLGYASLHALRHLLHGTLALHHIYEIGWFLQQSKSDRAFWSDWRHLHDPSLRRLEAVCFRLAGSWFGSSASEEVQREIEELPTPVNRWFEQYGDSPLLNAFSPNKDALWLHLALADSGSDRRAIFFRRVVPLDLPTMEVALAHDAGPDAKPSTSISRFSRYVTFLASRFAHHARQLPRTLVQGIGWWFDSKGFARELWVFLGASFLFNSGMYIFFFLFNLYLLDRGFKEDFLGSVTAALGIGGLVGTIPGGLIAQRFGLRRTLLLCMTLVPVVFGLRALTSGHDVQLVLAFVGGLVISMWGVCIPPVMAQLTNEENRPFGFSLLFSFGIGIGVMAGIAGGNLPGWLVHLKPAASAATLKQWALLVACGIAALGLWPVSRLQLAGVPAREKRFYPRSRFLLRFLPAVAIWSLVTGAFSPFMNAYFSKYLHLPVERIGLIFSASQLTQVLAILLSPYIFRKFGLVAGIMYMQIGTAISLGFLATSTTAHIVAATYAGFSALQWMSEPGMYSLLMNRVSPAERGGASALNALVIAACQAIAAWIAGPAFVRYGYPAVLTGTAAVALLSAILFRTLLKDSPAPESAPEPVLVSSARS